MKPRVHPADEAAIEAAFRAAVNMSADELRRWLDPPESRAVGMVRRGETESVGRQSGRRILALLGESDNPAALQWRRRCIANLARAARTLEDGMRIRFASPIKFIDGHEGTDFVIRTQGRRTALALTDTEPARYRVSNLARMVFSIIPQTKVHATQF